MSEANDSVNYTAQERAGEEWIVRRKDDTGGHFEAFRIVRRDDTLELGDECECGRAEQRDIMCRHIISVIKGTELRRNLFKSGGIGKKWSTEKFTASADFAPSSNEIWPSRCRRSSQRRYCCRWLAGSVVGRRKHGLYQHRRNIIEQV